MSLVSTFRTQPVRLTMSIPGGRTDLTAQNLYGQAKDAAREATDDTVSYAKEAYENSGDTFRDGSQAIAKKVRENPLGSMLIAGGIGFALALLMTPPPRRPPLRQRYFG
jgi:uncharacterized protein YjbJ (UPF0337 family)